MSKFIRADKNYNVTSNYRLDPLQVEGVEFLLREYNAILGFRVGTGKTLTSLSAVHQIISNSKNTVCFIACPISANTAFIKELTNRLKVPFSIFTTEQQRIIKGARYVLFNYSQLKYLVKYTVNCYKAGYKIIGIFDECHSAFNGEDTQTTTILSKLQKMFLVRIGLTGTPLSNSLEAFWRMCAFFRPEIFPSFESFAQRYIEYKPVYVKTYQGLTVKNQEVGGKNLDELKEICKKFILSRGIAYPLKFKYHTTYLSDHEISEYRKAVTGVYDAKSKKRNRQKAIPARIHDLQRVVDYSHSEMIKPAGVIGSKPKLLLNVLKSIIEKNEGAIIYTEYEDTYTYLTELLSKYRSRVHYNKVYNLNGKTSSAKRKQIEASLKPKDILILTNAGSQSFNLRQVNNVIFYSTPFSIKAILQTIGRMTRKDSTYQEMVVHFLETKIDDEHGTVDTYKRLITQNYMGTIQQVFGDDPAIPDLTNIDQNAMKQYKEYFSRKHLWAGLKPSAKTAR